MFWHCADIVIIPAPITQFTLAEADKPRLERFFELKALVDALDAYIIARICERMGQENGTTVVKRFRKKSLVPKSMFFDSLFE